MTMVNGVITAYLVFKGFVAGLMRGFGFGR
jgi:hypothetical protein